MNLSSNAIPEHIVSFIIPGEPVGKPRMTRRDKWAKRACVMKYRAWADMARLCASNSGIIAGYTPFKVSWTAYLPIPSSWSAKKKAAHAGALHLQKPDRDNVDKAILDALFSSDSGVAAGTIVKRWDDGQGPRIVIELTY